MRELAAPIRWGSDSSELATDPEYCGWPIGELWLQWARCTRVVNWMRTTHRRQMVACPSADVADLGPMARSGVITSLPIVRWAASASGLSQRRRGRTPGARWKLAGDERVVVTGPAFGATRRARATGLSTADCAGSARPSHSRSRRRGTGGTPQARSQLQPH